jgi:hypothetical protein
LISCNAFVGPDCCGNCFNSLAFSGHIVAGVGNVTVEACGFLSSSLGVNDCVAMPDLQSAVLGDLDFVGQGDFF